MNVKALSGNKGDTSEREEKGGRGGCGEKVKGLV